MKGTGIDYFYSNLGLDTGDFRVLYVFESGSGSFLPSVPLAQPDYTGVLSATGTFWSKPGSGFFNGNYLSISNASGLDSDAFTHLISIRKTSADGGVLFSSLTPTSGYAIGLTDSNKLYFEMVNGERTVTASYATLSAKSVVSVAYAANSLELGYYNVNSQLYETEQFLLPQAPVRSDTWTLGNGFTGYFDYYAYFGSFYSAGVMSQITSGVFYTPTGYALQTVTTCSTGITGLVLTPFFTTGVTGYVMVNSGSMGVGGFDAAFPAVTITVPLTGIVNSGILSSGVTGQTCVTVTGALVAVFENNLGYASGFGMQKMLILRHIETGDILKYSAANLYGDIYNRAPITLFSGFDMGATYSPDQINLFYNGVFAGNTGFALNGQYLSVSGATSADIITYDLFSGAKSDITGVNTFALTYTGQEVYLNGLNLISGLDFTTSGTTLTLLGNNTGVSGALLVSPIGLAYGTGQLQMTGAQSFARGTSNVYFNGLRQQLNSDYIEGCVFDRFNGNQFNENVNTPVYDNNGEFWE